MQLINNLEQLDNGFNRPQSICRELRETISNHFIARKTVFIFSKWCDWDYKESMNIAREISNLFFNRTVCPRLYVKRQRKTELLPNANEKYNKWVNDLTALV